MNGPSGERRLWPFVAAAFASGLAMAILIPRSSGADDEERIAPAPGDSAPAPAAASGGPGPSVLREGVPAGFGRTEEGAVAAAASFVCTGQTLLDMDPLSAEEAIRELSAEASADELVRRHLIQLDSAREVLASGTGPIVFRQAALAWRVEAYDDGRSRIAVWNVGVLSREGVAPPQAGWSTSVVDLVWERGDWRVWGESITPGPTPILDDSDAPSTSEQFANALSGFTDFGART